jgi:hypothetical protein
MSVVAGTDGDSWLAGYLRRVAELAQDTAHAQADLARDWGERSLQPGDWTVDSLTGQVLDAWYELTPLVERGLELGLEAVYQAIAAVGLDER